MSRSQPSSLSPVLLIPGDGGNQLEARRLPSSQWFKLWLDVWQLRSSRLRAWADTIKIVYDREKRVSRNVEGVETRVPGWGSTETVEYLDPSWSAWLIGDVGNYLHDMVEYFTSLGYKRGETIRAAPYDFRYGPQSQAEYFTKMRGLVEEMYSTSGQPVTIISHSMGGLFGLYFLQQQSLTWLETHVKTFVPLNTPWRGAVIQLNTYASGYNMGIDMIDPLVIREEQRSYETGVFIMPLRHTWRDQDQVLLQTPARNYTVRNMAQFFQDINFSQGMEMMDNIAGYVNLTHPRVRTVCLYTLGVKTPVKLVYKDQETFPDSQPDRVMGDGDGTVTRESLEGCNQFLTENDLVRSFQGINHGDVLKSRQVFEFIKSEVLSSELIQ